MVMIRTNTLKQLQMYGGIPGNGLSICRDFIFAIMQLLFVHMRLPEVG